MNYSTARPLVHFNAGLIALLLWGMGARAQHTALEMKVDSILRGKHARVGVCVAGPVLSFKLGAQDHFPMQSVMKLHLAITVLHAVDEKRLSLDQDMLIRHADLEPRTYSPMRDAHASGDFHITLRELLRYAVAQSDNNACDILFGLLGGPEVVNRYMHSLGIGGVSIVATEREMHASWPVQYNNWSTPDAAVQLLQRLDVTDLLSAESRSFLWSCMTDSVRRDRIGGLLPAGTVVAHKAGTSDTNGEGLTAAFNDIGIVVLPDGEHMTIAVFVSDSHEDEQMNTEIIAAIARAAWEMVRGDLRHR